METCATSLHSDFGARERCRLIARRHRRRRKSRRITLPTLHNVSTHTCRSRATRKRKRGLELHDSARDKTKRSALELNPTRLWQKERCQWAGVDVAEDD